MVVEEFKTTQGVHIRILDDAFRGQTDEERERIAQEARRCAWRIAEAKARRERAEETNNDTSSAPDGAPFSQGEGLRERR